MNHIAAILRRTASVPKDADDKETTDINPPKTHFKTKLLSYKQKPFIEFAGFLLLIIMIVFGVMALKESLAQIKVAGIPISSTITASKLSEDIERKADSYRLEVEKTDNTKQKFSLADAGIKVDYDRSAEAAVQAKKNGSWWNNLQWWHDQNLPLAVKINKSELDNFIKTKTAQSLKPSKNAAITIDNGQVLVSEAAAGSRAEVKDVKTTVLNNAKFMRNNALVQHEVKLEPAITADNLADSKTKAESIIQTKVSFAINEKTFSPEPKDIGTWITTKTNEDKHTVDIGVDQQAVINYLNSIAAPYVRPSHTALVAQENGTSVTLISGADGTDITDKVDIAKSVADSLMDGQALSQNLEIKDSSYSTITANATDKWLAVDLTTKQLYAVEHQKIVQTFSVSAGAPTTPTVTGRFAIYQKFAKQDMKGANADGSDYFQPNVEWINYFYRDYAVHGNYWRPDNYFGVTNSSHGCVGLRNADAKWIYDWSAIGTPVRVYN